MMYYIVAYDITNDRRRNQVAKILKDFGQRTQYSVFECQISRHAYLRLQDRLKDAINRKEDSVTFYSLCQSCQKHIERMGTGKGLDKKSYII